MIVGNERKVRWKKWPPEQPSSHGLWRPGDWRIVLVQWQYGGRFSSGMSLISSHWLRTCAHEDELDEQHELMSCRHDILLHESCS
jgi:hypothetical protein